MNQSTLRLILIALTAYTAALGGLVIIFLARSTANPIPRFVRFMLIGGFIGYGLSLPGLWYQYRRRREKPRP